VFDNEYFVEVSCDLGCRHVVKVLKAHQNGVGILNGAVYYSLSLTAALSQLIGGTSPTAPMDVLINEAPKWRRSLDPPSGMFQNRRIWDGLPAPNKRIIMVTNKAMSLSALSRACVAKELLCFMNFFSHAALTLTSRSVLLSQTRTAQYRHRLVP
jgi:hypothetical protein